MLNSTVLKFDAEGRIRFTNTPAVAPGWGNGGTPMVGDLLAAVSTTVDDFWNGIGYDNSFGGVRIAMLAGGAIHHYTQGGLPMTVDNQLVTSTGASVAYRNAGLPFDSAGRLALSIAETPPTFDAFSTAFSGAFG